MTETIFQPVRGTEEAIRRRPIVEGRVYFAYDTGKIYLDKDGHRYLMSSTSGGSGSAGFVWAIGDDSTIVKESDDEASKTYLIYPEALEDHILPKRDQLILNADGRFFRVIDDESSEYVIGELIAVSGAGGSGGGVSTQDVYISYDPATIDSGFTYIYGQTSFAKFTASSDVDNQVTLTFVITQKGEQVESFSERIQSGSTYNFDTARLPKGTDITVTVRASSVSSSMGNNDSRTRRILDSITTVELGINKDSSFNQAAIRTGEVGISFIPIYNGLNQTLHVTIDGDQTLKLSDDSRNQLYQNFKPTGNSTYTVIIPEQSHKAHTIALQVSTVISGTRLYSDPVIYNVAWRDPESNVPIIWFGDFEKTVINYNECVIPFMVYDPEKEANSMKTKVQIEKDGVAIPTSPMEVQYDAANWIKLDVTNLYEAAAGPGKENVFSFTCGGTTENISIFVTTEGARELGLANEGGLILNLTSTGRSNNETSTSRSNWSYNNYTTTFKNFNWYNNGWLNDDDGNGSYLSVANGASADVNLDAFTLAGSEFNYSFEVRFRVRNIQEYSTLIRTIPMYYVEENTDSWTLEQIAANGYTMKKDDDGNTIMDKASPKTISSTAGVIFKYLNSQGYGFCIGTQEAYFRTPSGIANVRYKEDEIINLSFVISKTSGLMSIYLNGILSGALSLTSTAAFRMDNNKFEITSEFCDIDIFKLRIYRAELQMPDVIHNYISDIHSIPLYDQNQLTDSTDGTILLYNKLLQYNENYPDNPSMPYAIWEIIDNGSGFNDPNKGPHSADDDKLPYFKGNDRYCKVTFVNPSLDRAYEKGLINDSFYKTHSPSYVAIGVGINVQGTSSQAYPRRNFKTKMKSATSKKDADKVVHDDWGWFYTGGPFKADYQAWLTGKDAEGHVLDEELRAEALSRCAFTKWNMDNAACKTNKFTWKIDYMESSGTYNTGFANLVGNSIYDYHPLSRINGLSTDGQGYRTSVYGFPVLVFHKHSTTADKALAEDPDPERAGLVYEYIGRYNLNLDKGSNEFYGFELEDIHPFEDGEKPMADVAECWELRDNQGTWTSFKYPDEMSRQSHFGTLTADGALEVGKHFEPRYNNEADQIEYCRGAESAEDLGYKDVTKIEMADGSLRDLSTLTEKNRFLRQKFTNLEILFEWLDSTDTSNVPITDTGAPLSSPQTFNNTVYYMVETVREDGKDVVYYVDIEGNKLVKVSDVTQENARKFYTYVLNGVDLMQLALAPDNYTGTVRPKDDTLITYNTDCAGYRLKKFVKEFNQHLDLEYCLIYFILTELLLCYDSRGKNMMIASWGRQESGGEYIWYPIFYDIDTQLGLNNIGAVLWDYDTDATADGTFSTANSVLWQNFFAGFRKEIEAKYRSLRKSSRLTETTIEGAYLCDPNVFSNSYAMRGVRPVIALGLDEWYKYIAPGKSNANWYNGTDRRFGFYVQSYENGQQKTTDASYVYTCQGDRKLSRELFIRNRLNFLDSWWLAGAYDSTSSGYKTEIMIRANANDTSTSDTYLDETKITSDVPQYTRTHYPKKFYDAVPEFEITPFLSQYVTVFYDEDPLTPTIKFDGINAVTTHTTPSVANGYKAIYPYNEQLTYIPGGDYLSDLGDLSLKYPSHFKLNTGKRLTQLLIGSDAPNYANGIIGKESGTFDLNDGIETTNKKGLLQKIVLTGLTALAESQDVSGSAKLREFRALRTAIPSVIFADGAPLDTVHLPRTTTSVNIVHAKNLTNILTSLPTVMISDPEEEYVYAPADTYKGLYIENLTDWDKNTQVGDIPEVDFKRRVSQVDTLNLTDVNLGYDSYVLLDNAVDIRERFKPDKFLALNLENVNWSPYANIESDVEFDSNKVFYELTDHNDFVVYDPNKHTQAKWDLLKLNNKLFVYDSSPEMQVKESLITDVHLLETIMQDCMDATSVATNHYRSIKDTEGITKPNISGIMYISNDNEHLIDETNEETGLGIKEIQEFFKNLKVYARHVAKSNIVKYIYRHNGYDEEVDLIRYASSITHPNTITNQLFKRNNYDFVGWCLEDPEQNENAEVVLVYDLTSSAENNSDRYTTTATWDNLVFTEELSTITLFAKYRLTPRNVSFYIDANSDPIIVATPHGQLINLPEGIPYKDDSQLELTHTYQFQGWAQKNENQELELVENIENIRVESNNLVFYGVFEEVSVYDNVLRDSSYFNVYEYTLNNNICWALDLLPTKVKLLKGKITLPREWEGHPISIFNNYRLNIPETYIADNITHIFWEDGNDLTKGNLLYVGICACFNWPKLRYFELPCYGTTIMASAFANTNGIGSGTEAKASHLFYGLSQDEIDNWFARITEIQSSGLSSIGSINNRKEYTPQTLSGKTIKLSNIQKLDSSALTNIICDTIIFGSVSNTTLNYENNNFKSSILTGTAHCAGGRASLRGPISIIYYDNVHTQMSADQVQSALADHFGLDPYPGAADPQHEHQSSFQVIMNGTN